MLYKFLHLTLPLAFRIVFKRFYILYENNLPKEGAVIAAPNHVNAFMDAILSGATSRRSFNYLTRGDVFDNKLAAFFLRALHQIPIFRVRDGLERVKENDSSFAEALKKMNNNEVILIFPEGDCVQHKKLRTPLKKGLARMAFDFVEKNNWNTSLMVVPIGNNYSQPSSFRSEATLVYGQPIDILNYKDIYHQNPQKAISQLNSDLTNELREVVLELPEGKEQLAQKILDLHEANYLASIFEISRQDDKWLREKAITKAICNENTEQLAQLIKNYDDKLKALNLDYHHLTKNEIFIGNIAFLLLGWVVALPTLIVLYPLLHFVTQLTKKMVKAREFYFSVRFGLLMATAIILFSILFLLFLFVNPIMSLVVPIGIYLAAMVTINYVFNVEFIFAKFKAYGISKPKHMELRELRNKVELEVERLCGFKL